MSWLTSWKDTWNSKNSSLNFSSTIERQTRNLLITHVYRQTVVGQLTSLFCASILLLGVYSSVDKFALWGWFFFSCLIAFSRVGLSILYEKKNGYENNLPIWRLLFIAGAFFGGLTWGFAGSYLFWFSDANQQTLIILIIAGITAGAVPILSADLAGALFFLVAALLPLIVQLFFYPDTNYFLFAITVMAYFVYMIIIAIRSHRLIKQTIGLQFEKEALIEDLNDVNKRFDLVNEKLTMIEMHDSLTGLPNRKLFMVCLTDAIKRAEISQKNLALFYLDLDNFKFVNDAYGFEIGDQLLELITKRIKENLREPDIIGRLGGDEFAVMFENQSNPAHVSRIAKQMCEMIAKPFNVGEFHINISASIGISLYPIDGVLADVLIKKADKAMQYIKEHGHNNYHFNTEFGET